MALIFGKKNLFWKTGIDNKGLNKDAKKTKGILGGLSKSAKLVSVAFLAIVSAGVILAKTLKSIISAGMPFGETMSHVLAVTRAMPSEFRALRESAMELGATTAFTATQVGQMQVELAKLGFTSQEILKVTAPALDAAAASGATLAEVAAVAAGNLRVFGIEAGNMQRVTDVMAESFASSALDLEKYRESTKSAAPMAEAFGLTIEQLTALLGKLADKQISGSIAGMGLKNVFSQLKDEESSLSKVLGGTANTWEEFIDLLVKAKARGQEFNDQALSELDKRIQPVIINLAKSSEELEEYAHQLENSTGAAKEMAETRLDNLAGDVKILNSAMEGLYLTIYNKLKPALRGIVQTATKAVTFLNNAFKIPKGMDGLQNEIDETKIKFLTLIKTYQSLRETTNRNQVEEDALVSTMKELNENYGEYLTNINLETASREDLNTAIKATTDALIQEATTKAILEERSLLLNEIGNKNKEIYELEKERIETEERITIEKSKQEEKLNSLRNEYGEIAPEVEKMVRMTNTQAHLNAKLNDLNNKINKSTEDRNELQQELNEHMATYKSIFDDITSEERIAKLRELREALNLETMANTLKEINIELDEMDDPDLEIIPEIPEDELTKIDEWTESFYEKNEELLSGLAGMITDSLSNAFADFIIDGEKDWDQFIKYLEKQLLASAIQALFFKLLGVGSGGGFAGLFGSLFGGGTTTSLGGGLNTGNINNYVENGVNYTIPDTRPNVNVNSTPIVNNDFSRLEKRIEALSKSMQNANFILNVNNKQAGNLVNAGAKFNNATRDR